MKMKLGFLGWRSIPKSKTIQEIWRLEKPSSVWFEEHPYGGRTSGKWRRLMKGRLCGNNSRSISSRSTSPTGTMMIRLKNSISWDWDNRPWKSMQTSSWICWGMLSTSKMKKWKSNVFWVDYLSITKNEMSLMSLELWKRLSEKISTVMTRTKASLIIIRLGRKRRMISLDRQRKDSNLPASGTNKKGNHHRL